MESIAQQIERELLNWPGVSAHLTALAGSSFMSIITKLAICMAAVWRICHFPSRFAMSW